MVELSLAMATRPESKSWIVFFMFPLLMVICEIFGLGVARSAVEHYRLERHGRTTDGTAFFSEYKRGGKSGGAYYVRYVFECNGIRYKGEWRTSKAWVRANKLPMRIRVRFLPDDPAVNWPPDAGVRTALPVKALVLLLCLGASVYFGTRVVLAWRRSGSRWSPLGLALTAASLPLMALAQFDVAPMVTVMLAMGCVVVAAGLSPMRESPNVQGIEA